VATSSQSLDFEKPIVELERQIEELKRLAGDQQMSVDEEIAPLEQKLAELRDQIYHSLTPWQRVQVARNVKRPFTSELIQLIFTDFIELHGDRAFRDDPAIIGGWARLDGETVMVMGQQRGRDTKEILRRNFGMPHPEGYRKALRMMKLAEKFHVPVLTFIDTMGAWAGIGAEERGQSEAIARNLLEMTQLTVPIIATVIGEGGSGGALALGVADRVLMMENAVYSVITVEGCAAILWKDGKSPEMREKAATALRVTAPDLFELRVIDEIVPEPPGGAHSDHAAAAKTLHPVQQAWIEEQTPLCGFCQNGMLIKATELLESNASPTVSQIKDAFTSGVSPHLCRCGSYTAIIQAVQRAAGAMKRTARSLGVVRDSERSNA